MEGKSSLMPLVVALLTFAWAIGASGVPARPLVALMQGTIQSKSGAPVGGVEISCWWYTVSPFEKEIVTQSEGQALSEANGTFRLTCPFPVGATGGYVVTHHPEYGITVTPWQRTSAGLYRGVRSAVDIPAALLLARATAPIVLPDRARVEGTVRDPAGNPVVGASVSVSIPIPFRPESTVNQNPSTRAQRLDAILSTTTGPDGTYSLDGLPQLLPIALHAWHPEAGEASLGTSAGSLDGQPFNLVPDTAPYDVVLPGAGSLLGRVTFPEDAPSPTGAFVRVSPMTRVPMEARNAMIDAEGNYAVPALAPCHYQLELIAPPFTANLASTIILPGTVAQAPLMAAGSGALLRGTFTDARTGDIADDMEARIDLVYQDEGVVSIESGVKNGVFEIVARPGIVTLQVTGLNAIVANEDVEKRLILKHGTRNETLKFRVSPYRNITGRVLLPDGGPAAGAVVALSREIRVSADSSGRFSLRVPPQSFEGGGQSVGAIFGEPPTFLGGATLDRIASADAELIITAREPASVSGRLLDLDGQPAPGIPIMIVQSGYWDHGTRTDAQGRFHLAGLISGMGGMLSAGPSFQELKEPLQPGEDRDVGSVQIDLRGMRAGAHVVIDVPAAPQSESNQP